LRLLLFRHAKSDWSKDADDHGRPLAARGRKAAPAMALYMARNGYLPELVLCSTARRTRETLDLLKSSWPGKPPVRYERSLYLADWPVLFSAVKKTPARTSPLLVIGHNPGLEQLAIALALRPKTSVERARLERLAQKFPTAALAVLDFQVSSWRDLSLGSGQLIDYVCPKDLSSADDGDDE
jgi:phosphohistidine phosphatase